jgi:hypothetical protein
VSKSTASTRAKTKDWARPIQPSDFNWEQPARGKLPHGAVTVLTYMSRVETATEYYFRLMRTPIVLLLRHIDNFLKNWIREEVPHGEMLQRYLEVRGTPIPVEATTWSRRFQIRRNQAFMSFISLVFWGHSVTVHMVWGYINELTTKLAYRRLDAMHGEIDPLLRDLLQRIGKQEGGHETRYLREGRQRLDKSRLGRIITRWTLAHFWTMVGEGYRDKNETQAIIRYLFPPGHPATDEFIREVDGAIDRLAGLENLNLVRKAIGQVA